MDISMDSLEEIGKTSFIAAFQTGEFYFPKVVWGYLDGQTHIGLYQTDFDLFQVLISEAAAQGPLEFIAHTTDAYWLNTEGDALLTSRVKAGSTSATQEFENGNPKAFEALAITMVDKDGCMFARTCPYERQGRTLRWLYPVKGEATETGGRYIDAMAAAIKSSYAAADENA